MGIHNNDHGVTFLYHKPVLRIHNILAWIRIRGSMPLTNGSGFGPCYFHHWPSKRQKNIFKQIFCILLFEGTFTSFFQCCGSGMYIQDPGSWFLPSLVSDPASKNRNKREGWKKSYLFCGYRIHKIENYFIFEMLKKKNLGHFSENYITFHPNICH